MSANAKQGGTIRIGLLADEPIRVAGLVSIFEQPVSAQPAPPPRRQFFPVVAHVDDLLADQDLRYMVIDLQGSYSVESLEVIRKVRPDIRLIVIGPAGNAELVMNIIMAGARGYLDPTASPERVLQAVEEVTSGSIWAPRRLLSRLIDRLIKPSDTSLTADPQLTYRERQVLELIGKARTNREIAADLGIEESTVKAYVGKLMRKTGADNRIKLTMSAMSIELPPEPDGKRVGRTGRLSTD